MSDRKVGKILGIVGKALIDSGAELGIPGLTLQAIGAIARKIGKLVDSGASVDEILKGMETFDDLVNPFRGNSEATKRETPSSKKRET